jgi:hypothetical protein
MNTDKHGFRNSNGFIRVHPCLSVVELQLAFTAATSALSEVFASPNNMRVLSL